MGISPVNTLKVETTLFWLLLKLSRQQKNYKITFKIGNKNIKPPFIMIKNISPFLSLAPTKNYWSILKLTKNLNNLTIYFFQLTFIII